MASLPKRIWQGITDKLDDAPFMRKFHGWFAVIWFVAAFPICIILANSVPFIVFVSVYAIVVSHWSSWQAARVEELQAEQGVGSDHAPDSDSPDPVS